MNRSSYIPNNMSTSSLKKDPYNRTVTGFYQKGPLYPIGPSLTQQEFRPMTRGFSPSPYLNRQSIRPPSYENRILRSQIGAPKGTVEDREKKLVYKNQNEIEEQQKRRKHIQVSYEREIQMLNKNLIRNMDRKQKLMNEIQKLQNQKAEMTEKLQMLQPPKLQLNTYDPLDRKQQEIVIMKNKLINRIREKETQLHKEEQQEEKYWEEQITQKQRILLNLEETTQSKRLQAHKHRQPLEKLDIISIEDEVMEEKYRDYLSEMQQLESKIKRYSDERQKIQRQLSETINLKKPQLHNQRVTHQELERQVRKTRMRIEQLERVSKEMEAANKNLLKEYKRKQQMIEQYQMGIHQLKEGKDNLQLRFGQVIKTFRQKYQNEEFLPEIADEISKIQELIRSQNFAVNKVRNQHQKLYQLLCSTASKNIHQVFNHALIL